MDGHIRPELDAGKLACLVSVTGVALSHIIRMFFAPRWNREECPNPIKFPLLLKKNLDMRSITLNLKISTVKRKQHWEILQK